MIKNAFQCFDEDNSGSIGEERLRELLTTMGDRYTDEQVKFEKAFKFLLLGLNLVIHGYFIKMFFNPTKITNIITRLNQILVI